MENSVNKHLQDLYGLNPNIPHMALQFPRLPPGLTHPMFKIHENPVKEQFSRDVETVSQKLQGFQHMYQQYAAGLLSGHPIIPPSHPLYTKQNSVQTLKAENDKLLKENTELKKKLEKKSKK
ncbi:hypothetical protein [Nitrosopumilus sp. b2]|uniref:hypothetical protein n=1 Tax=Nitrosopumilus sp. b2 TaxID=2109908 RepID=UPI0015F3859E|nr:hypothetical protein [Nitrosopumilus sp. b2]KAF6244445.1 hypothetical protein C6989_09245 [Nitrosopumilus sp. b2]